MGVFLSESFSYAQARMWKAAADAVCGPRGGQGGKLSTSIKECVTCEGNVYKETLTGYIASSDLCWLRAVI